MRKKNWKRHRTALEERAGLNSDRIAAEMQAEDDARNAEMCSCIHRRDHHVDWGHTGACQWETCTCEAFERLLGSGETSDGN